MLDPKNTLVITGGIVRDPESPTANLIKFSIAVDYAGSDKSGNQTGYFDVVFWTNNDSPNTKFVKDQVTSGKMKQGSQIQLVGRLVQERWVADDSSKKSRVVIQAESVTYAGGNRSADSSSSSSGTASVPDDF